MATAVAGGAAAPGAERGREPAWRRDLAGAAAGRSGGRRKATRTWAPAQDGAVEGLPRPGPGLPPPARGGLRGAGPATATTAAAGLLQYLSVAEPSRKPTSKEPR